MKQVQSQKRKYININVSKPKERQETVFKSNYNIEGAQDQELKKKKS